MAVQTQKTMKAKALMGLQEEEKKRMSEVNLGSTQANIVPEINENEDDDGDTSRAFER